MGKLTYSVMVIFAIQLVAIMFLGVSFPGTAVYSAVVGNEQWDGLDFIDWTSSILLGIGAIGIVAGLTWWKNDFAFYASVAAVFLSFGQTYYELYQIVASKLYGFGIPNQVTVIFFVPLMLPWIFILLDWVRGRD